METLEQLAIKLYDAKEAEKDAKGTRIECEEAIAALVETDANGSKTVAAGDKLKVVVKRAMGYKADVDAIRALDIPDEVMPLKMTDPQPAGYVFDEKAYEALKDEHPDIFKTVATAVTAAPLKTSVTLKLA
jgi:hypothetical protein